MPVSQQLNCIFVHVPRNGGTSIEVAFGLLGGQRNEDKTVMFGHIESAELKREKFATDFLQHLSASELRSLMGDDFDRYYRFAFVRNPWERVVSVYFYHRKVTGEVVSFRKFVETTKDGERNHQTPQHRYIFDADGRFLVDFVGRFEHLTSDFAKVCAALKIERELPHVHAATIGDYRSYYDATTRDIVGRKYAEDIDRFGYSFGRD